MKIFENFFLPKVRNNAVVGNCYFQQNGASSHYARQARDYLNQLFLDKWIRRRALWNVPLAHLTKH